MLQFILIPLGEPISVSGPFLKKILRFVCGISVDGLPFDSSVCESSVTPYSICTTLQFPLISFPLLLILASLRAPLCNFDCPCP